MPVPQIVNSALAFNSAGQDNAELVQAHIQYVVTAGTINTVGEAVYFGYNASTGILNCTGATSANAASAGGFAQATATTVGVVIPVATEGLCQVLGGSAISVGQVFSVSASGWTWPASTVIGSNWGVAIQNQVAGGSPYWAQITRM